MERNRLARILLTVALVVVFAWFGLDKLRHPLLWIGFLPLWLDGFLAVGKDSWITVVGILELLFALLLLIPIRRIRQAGALLMALHLVAVLIQVGWNDIGVRDTGLLLSSVALLSML